MTKISNIVNFGYPYLSFKGLISVWKTWPSGTFHHTFSETMKLSGGQLPPHGGNWLVKSQQWFSENPWLMSTLKVFFLLHYINRRINNHISLRSPKRFFLINQSNISMEISACLHCSFTQDKGPLDANSASGNPSGGGIMRGCICSIGILKLAKLEILFF